MAMHFPQYPPNWKDIIKKVKQRDSYTCKTCGTKHPANSKYLRVHHIVPLSKGGANDMSNLVTLCAKCHALEHDHLRRFYENGTSAGSPSGRKFRRSRKSYRYRRKH